MSLILDKITYVTWTLGFYKRGVQWGFLSCFNYCFCFNSWLPLQNLFIYSSLQRVFVAACGLSLVAASGGYSLLVVRGLLFVVASLLWSMGSRAQAQELWHTGLVILWHVGSSHTRDQTHVPCFGRWISIHLGKSFVCLLFILHFFFFQYFISEAVLTFTKNIVKYFYSQDTS